MRRTKQEVEKLKELAQYIYLSDIKITLKVLAEKVGITEKTAGSWAKQGNWEEKRTSLLTTKTQQLAFLFNQLKNLNESIAIREKKYADTKEANTIIQLTAAIKNLETETGLGDIIQTAKEFIAYTAQSDYELAKTITKLFDEFINHKAK